MSFSLKCVVVPPYSKAVIYYNDKTAEYLDEGHYYYWNGSVDVSYKIFDMRVQQLDISGQDILTKDRVGVRVNFTANWKIIDYEKLAATYSNISQTLYAAEKRAQANVITRREEVASTRSLLNTAKLMDENATLRRLKELEYIEKICENIGEITVDARSSILTQLANIIGTKDSE